MRYVIEQQLTLATPRFSITDEAGNVVFQVEGKALRILEQLWVRDPSGVEVAFIKQKRTMRPTYEISRGGSLAAVVVMRQKWFKVRFHVTDAATGAEMIATGKFARYEYSFDRGGRVVAHVTKKLRFLKGDTYVLEASEDEDQVLLLCAVLVIDAISDMLERRRNQ